MAGIVQDITERKLNEERLREADQRKNEFLAMLGHEFRTPLTPISNIAQLLCIPSLAEHKLSWASEVLNRNVAHLSRLVDDLLDISRITQGVVKIQRERIELVGHLKNTAESIHTLIQRKHQALNLKLPDPPLYLEGDPVRLTQVFSNLLNNASKYSDDGGYIDLAVNTEGPSIVVRVHDNGMGIEASLLPHIFDLFFQSERGLDRSEGGLGLGLTLVKKLVESHGGQIKASSPGIGQGSTFSILLPAYDEAANLPATPLPTPPDTEMRVLVVDDERDVRESMRLLLEMLGHEVRMADTGDRAIKLIEEFLPVVILLDIGLPGENGYQVARRIRQLPCGSDLLLVAVSGYGSPEVLTLSKAAGFDHHLVKPVPLNSLLDLLSERRRITGDSD
jgi:CheY-like chemotaxis protein